MGKDEARATSAWELGTGSTLSREPMDARWRIEHVASRRGLERHELRDRRRRAVLHRSNGDGKLASPIGLSPMPVLNVSALD